MRKYAVLLSLLLGFNAGAELITEQKPVVCAEVKTIIQGLATETDVRPFWEGVGEDSRYILLVSPKSGDWYMVEYNNTAACVIGTGTKAKQIFSKPAI